MTALLSCHVQNYVLIGSWELESAQTIFLWDFCCELINHLWNGSLGPKCQNNIGCRRGLLTISSNSHLWHNQWLHRGCLNTLRPRQDGRHFPDDNFECFFLNENIWFSLKISLKFVHKGPINNYPSFVQIMAWRRPGDKPLSELMMVSLLMHIWVIRPQWVNIKMSSYPYRDSWR